MIKLISPFRIPLYLHYSTILFGILLLFLDKFFFGVFLISLLFVIFHEYGHCLMARYFDWTVKDVLILPIGGLARINFKSNNPTEEIFVALAGPLVNLVFFILFSLAAGVYYTFLPDESTGIFIFAVMIAINLMIMGFNLIPCLPMDGGRVLRSTLAFFMDYVTATLWAVRISQVLGVVLAVLSFIYGYYSAGIIFLLVIFMARQELYAAKFHTLLDEVKLSVALALNKPELQTAELSVLLYELESVNDESLRAKLKINELECLIKKISSEELT